jgi:acetyl esterase
MSSLLGHLRRRAGAAFTDAAWSVLARTTGGLPNARPEKHGVERTKDIPYLDTAKAHHTLDVYRPIARSGPCPVVLYIHGGGFRILSKDTHWMMPIAFARRGYVVFNINYRLAPEHPFPAAVEDGCAALAWVLENAESYGGDARRLVLAGESAGANLVTSLAVAASWPRPEPYAQRVWQLAPHIQAVVPACGIYQVTDVDRLRRRKRKLSPFVLDRLREVEEAYLPKTHPRGEARYMADPLLWLERADPPVRPLPPFFTGVGTADPLLDDTRRLKDALDRLGAVCEVRYYPGEIHAFHALMWRQAARSFWRDTYAFLDAHVSARDDAQAGVQGSDRP